MQANRRSRTAKKHSAALRRRTCRSSRSDGCSSSCRRAARHCSCPDATATTAGNRTRRNTADRRSNLRLKSRSQPLCPTLLRKKRLRRRSRRRTPSRSKQRCRQCPKPPGRRSDQGAAVRGPVRSGRCPIRPGTPRSSSCRPACAGIDPRIRSSRSCSCAASRPCRAPPWRGASPRGACRSGECPAPGKYGVRRACGQDEAPCCRCP